MKNNILKKLWFLSLFVGFSTFGQTTITGLKKDYTESMDSLLTYVNGFTLPNHPFPKK